MIAAGQDIERIGMVEGFNAMSVLVATGRALPLGDWNGMMKDKSPGAKRGVQGETISNLRQLSQFAAVDPDAEALIRQATGGF